MISWNKSLPCLATDLNQPPSPFGLLIDNLMFNEREQINNENFTAVWNYNRPLNMLKFWIWSMISHQPDTSRTAPSINILRPINWGFKKKIVITFSNLSNTAEMRSWNSVTEPDILNTSQTLYWLAQQLQTFSDYKEQ